jgi:hypothetical protein
MQLEITSKAFQNDGNIPSKYTCEGSNINPPLTIGNIPGNAKCIALILEDPDAPNGTFTHWIAWNIKPDASIAEESSPGMLGKNDFGETGYGGPCPPSGSHRYFFRVYALDSELNLDAGSDRKTMEQAMHPHVIAQGYIMGRYSKGANK